MQAGRRHRERQPKAGYLEALCAGVDMQASRARLPVRQFGRLEADLLKAQRAHLFGAEPLGPAIGRIARTADPLGVDGRDPVEEGLLVGYERSAQYGLFHHAEFMHRLEPVREYGDCVESFDTSRSYVTASAAAPG